MGRVSPPASRCADDRYAFKKERGLNDPIEIEDDDDWVDPSRKFYWNPYSGELSLTFPTSNNKAKGGILADAMGESIIGP
jgi:DNA repair protein RAD5